MADQAGTRVPSAAANGKMGHSLISDRKFRQLYETALKLQMIGKRSGGKGRNAGWLRGREAVFAGVVADLRADDVVVAEYAGSVDEILAGHLAVRLDQRSFEERVIEALSDAVGNRMRKTGRITAIFLDGTRNGKILPEARALAIAAKLPVLFVEEPQKARGARSKKKPAAIEYPSIPVDTQDVIAMYRVAHESITRAREGSGPTHIVGVRWAPVAKSKKHTGKAATEDAVEHLEHWLMARGLPAQEWRREIVAEFGTRGSERNFGALHADGAGEEPETRAIA
jgi:TPP-dependent pyruvate/acetoin dehydrogenase alpha subunit